MPTAAAALSEPADLLPSDRECRVWERHACDFATNCQPVAARGPNELKWQARVRDISVGGIGIVAVRRFERGTGLAIEIPATDANTIDTLLVRVIHVSALPEGGWLLGCEFVSPLSEDEVAKLAQRYDFPPAPEEPSVPDLPSLDLDEDKVYPETTMRRHWVLAGVRWHNVENGVSRTVRRLFLKGNWPLAEQSILRLWLKTENGETCLAQVVIHSCLLQQGEWLVEYSILGQPSQAMQHWQEKNSR